MKHFFKTHSVLSLASALLLLNVFSIASAAPVDLADQPVFSAQAVPGNLALALSVEWPTVVNPAHLSNTYSSSLEYLGYFDPQKCYAYSYSATEADRHFYPIGPATAALPPVPPYTCSGAWSGNFLNWATMQAIDPFRWTLTGGYRVRDTAGAGSTPGVTWLEKAHSPSQGAGMFANRTLTTGVNQVTPFALPSFRMRVHDRGNRLIFTGTGNPDNASTPYTGAAIAAATVYEVNVRVKVCDGNIAGFADKSKGLESNCVRYGASPNYTYKPEGLMQKYSQKIRYSTFGYLNDDDIFRDGGVLRARQAFIGPTQPVPLTNTTIANLIKEWDENTGVMIPNPVPADATLTNSTFGITVTNSGSMNYLNKFGQINVGNFKSHDPVSEMYYGAVRYFKHLGSVPEWTNMALASVADKTKWIDSFPVITTSKAVDSDDPIIYSCQKNFILGVGDIFTHADKNVPNETIANSSNEPTPPAVFGSLGDDPVPSSTRTNEIGALEGLGAIGNNPIGGWCCSAHSYLMAGIAYDSNVNDIRPTVAGKIHTQGKQTIQTYWLDVLENQVYQSKNQYWLTTKYGGFKAPVGFDPATATAADFTGANESRWYTSARVAPDGSGQKLPDNYFIASDPRAMRDGLTSAFEQIALNISANTTASATAQPQVVATGDGSYSTSFKSEDWTSEVSGNIVDLTTTPITQTSSWEFSQKLGTQLSGTGWSSNRRMATWNGASGIAFQHSALTAAQKTALNTPWIASDDSSDYLNYLRGDRTNEVAGKYRIRNTLVADIVDSKLHVVGRPKALLEDEPGYIAFRDTWGAKQAVGATPATAGRRTMIYVGSNGGMLHAINGALYASDPGTAPVNGIPPEWDPKAGQEVFAYVPSALFQGPSLPAKPEEDGLAALGNPSYLHRYFVNATPKTFDIDLAKTKAGQANNASCLKAAGDMSPNWRTVLIGGLGKGGKSYYALDVTDPTAITSETILSQKVLWEFPRASDPKDATLNQKVGFSFGEAVVVRTEQYGWVVILTSGYNNEDGKSYFFIVDPCTGYLLQAPIKAEVAGVATEGLAHSTAYVLSLGSGLSDSAYGADLKGNVWRIDLTPKATAYADAVLIAQLTDAAGVPQPVTTRPKIEYDPKSLNRFVLVGTGRLLHKNDTSTQVQSFYAFKDGDVFSFDSTLGTITPTVNRIQRSDLVDISSYIGAGGHFTNQKGWYFNQGVIGDGGTYAGTGWRMVDNIATMPGTGYLGITSILPNSTTLSDPCLTSDANSIIYALNFGTGQTILNTGAATSPPSIFENSRVLDLRFFADGTTAPKLIYGTKQVGTVPMTIGTNPLVAPQWRRLNTREILLTE